MAEYSAPPRVPRGTSARERRFVSAFQRWGSNTLDLPGIAQRSELEALLAIIDVEFNTLIVHGTLEADAVNTTDLTVTGNASFATFSAATINATDLNVSANANIAELTVTGNANMAILEVTGNTTLNDVTADTITANTALLNTWVNTGDLYVSGNSTLGDATANSLTTDTLELGNTTISETNTRLFGTVVTVDGADHQIVAPEYVILMNTGDTTRTVTLPFAAVYPNTIIHIKKIDSGTGDVYIEAASIEGTGENRTYQVGDLVIISASDAEYQTDGLTVTGEGVSNTVYETIDGAANTTIANAYSAISMVSDAEAWHILSQYAAA